MRRALSSLSCALLACMGLALPGAVRAQTREDLERAERSFRAGAAAYAAGDYAAAIQALNAAYALTPLPAIAFSLAQAERRAYFVAHARDHLERAIALFRLYLEQVPSGGRRVDAVEAISQLEPLLSTLSASDTARQVLESKPTRLMITSDAEDARITLDDHPPAPSPVIREVTPGSHRIVVEAKGFHTATRQATALAGELLLNEISLEPRPSQLLVELPEEADVYVDGQYSNQGTKVHLALPAGPHQVAVASQGRRVLYRDVTLKRGEELRLKLTPERTRQRKLARGLFVVGGLGFGASLTLAVFALRAQGLAEDFLADREQGDVTEEDLDDYHEHVAQRDRLRIATNATLGASVALFITALILHQVDRPNPREIHRHADGRGGLVGPLNEARLRVEPWGGRQAAGGSVRVAF